MCSRFKVLITNPTVPREWLKLLDEKCDVQYVESFSKEELLKRVPGVNAILWADKTRLEIDVIEAAGPNLKVVMVMAGGYDHIDTETLKKHGIKLGYCPEVEANANLTILLTLAASRRYYEARLAMEQGAWADYIDQHFLMGVDLKGSTIGIVGLGRIGLTIAQKLLVFNVKTILYTGHSEKEGGKKIGAKFVDLDTIAKESDFVIVACPLTEETIGLCNKCFFSKMKKTAVFVNIGRGGVVVQNDLIDALKNKMIFAAGLDVTDPEPLPVDSELLKLPNVVITPHIGNCTLKAMLRIADTACKGILLGLEGKDFPHQGK